MKRCLFFTYRVLLQLYPPAFRQRFAAEMLEIAGAVEPGDWPMMFSDTGVAIVRCWIEGTHSTAVLTQPNAYVPIGESRINPVRLLSGLVLAIGILAGLCYVNDRWPPPPICRPVGEHHASRSAVTGSTFAARRAGI